MLDAGGRFLRRVWSEVPEMHTMPLASTTTPLPPFASLGESFRPERLKVQSPSHPPGCRCNSEVHSCPRNVTVNITKFKCIDLEAFLLVFYCSTVAKRTMLVTVTAMPVPVPVPVAAAAAANGMVITRVCVVQLRCWYC